MSSYKIEDYVDKQVRFINNNFILVLLAILVSNTYNSGNNKELTDFNQMGRERSRLNAH